MAMLEAVVMTGSSQLRVPALPGKFCTCVLHVYQGENSIASEAFKQNGSFKVLLNLRKGYTQN